MRKPNTRTHSEYFRYGDPISETTLLDMNLRNPIINFLSTGVVEEALGRGIELTDKDGLTIEQNDNIQNLFKENYEEIVKAITFERLLGDSLIVVFDTEESTRLKAIDKTQSKVAYKNMSYEGALIKTYQLETSKEIENEEVAGNIDMPVETVETSYSFNKLLSYHIMTKPSDLIGEGLSYLEPIFDDAMGYYFSSENAVYFAVRNGAGLRALTVPENIYNSDNTEQLEEMVSNINRITPSNSTIVVPGANSESNKADYEIQSLSDTQIDFTSIDDVLLNRIGVYTGIPVARLKGIEVGQISGSKVNESSYFAVLEKIQYKYKPLIKWCVDKLAELNSISLPVDYKIEYKTRANLSENEEADLTSKKVGILKTLVDNLTNFGLSLEQAIEISKLDYNPSQINNIVVEETNTNLNPVEQLDNQEA